MAWKAEEGEQMVAMQASDIKWAQWIRVARNYQLRVGLKDRSKETFDGFVREVSQRSSQGLWVWTGHATYVWLFSPSRSRLPCEGV